jgi:hypothetical protein
MAGQFLESRNCRRNSRRSSPYTVATSNNQALEHRRAGDRLARVTEGAHVQGRAISRESGRKR